jgi:hypothetical protein
MDKRQRIIPFVMIVIAMAGLARFSQGVRSVDVVGLFACGALTGTSVTRLMLGYRMRSRR